MQNVEAVENRHYSSYSLHAGCDIWNYPLSDEGKNTPDDDAYDGPPCMHSRISTRGCVRPSVRPSVTHELKPCKSAVFYQNYYHFNRKCILCRLCGQIDGASKKVDRPLVMSDTIKKYYISRSVVNMWHSFGATQHRAVAAWVCNFNWMIT